MAKSLLTEDPEENIRQNGEEVTYPVRLMFAVSDIGNDGFAVTFETPKGGIGFFYIWYGSADFKKIRFTDEGENTITMFVKESKGNWLTSPGTEIALKELTLRRDTQFPVRK